jgi:hypothetical protein
MNTGFTASSIVSEPDQPDDFTDVLDSIEFYMGHLKMSWATFPNSEVLDQELDNKVIAFVNRLHAAAGYTPATYEIARYALSYKQLKAIEKQLENAIKGLPDHGH